MKCPKCGSENLTVSFYYQYSHDYKINKNGKLSKRYKNNEVGSLEWSSIQCMDCGFSESSEDCASKFYIDANEVVRYE